MIDNDKITIENKLVQKYTPQLYEKLRIENTNRILNNCNHLRENKRKLLEHKLLNTNVIADTVELIE